LKGLWGLPPKRVGSNVTTLPDFAQRMRLRSPTLIMLNSRTYTLAGVGQLRGLRSFTLRLNGPNFHRSIAGNQRLTRITAKAAQEEAKHGNPTENHQNQATTKVCNFIQTGPLLNWYLA